MILEAVAEDPDNGRHLRLHEPDLEPTEGISNYRWSLVSGPDEVDGASLSDLWGLSTSGPNRNELRLGSDYGRRLLPGTWVFEVTVADDDGNTIRGEHTLRVLDVGQPPVAVVPPPQYFLLSPGGAPYQHVWLDGRASLDPDNLLSGNPHDLDLEFTWTDVTGHGECPVDNPLTPAYQLLFPWNGYISSSCTGVRNWELTVADRDGETDAAIQTVVTGTCPEPNLVCLDYPTHEKFFVVDDRENTYVPIVYHVDPSLVYGAGAPCGLGCSARLEITPNGRPGQPVLVRTDPAIIGPNTPLMRPYVWNSYAEHESGHLSIPDRGYYDVVVSLQPLETNTSASFGPFQTNPLDGERAVQIEIAPPILTVAKAADDDVAAANYDRLVAGAEHFEVSWEYPDWEPSHRLRLAVRHPGELTNFAHAEIPTESTGPSDTYLWDGRVPDAPPLNTWPFEPAEPLVLPPGRYDLSLEAELWDGSWERSEPVSIVVYGVRFISGAGHYRFDGSDAQEPIEFVRFANFDGLIDFQRIIYDPVPGDEIRPVLISMTDPEPMAKELSFVGRDRGAFLVWVADDRGDTTTDADYVVGSIGTTSFDGTSDDEPSFLVLREVDPGLGESAPNTGVFVSETQIVTTGADWSFPEIDTALSAHFGGSDTTYAPLAGGWDDVVPTHSDYLEQNVEDDHLNDRSHLARVGGNVEFKYFPRASVDLDRGTVTSVESSEMETTVTVCERSVDDVFAPDAAASAPVRLAVLMEPWDDTEPFSECTPTRPGCGENCRDNGCFDWDDRNGNGWHDRGEISEAFADVSAGKLTPHPAAYLSGTWGPVVAPTDLKSEVVRARWLWAQACIHLDLEVVLIDPAIVGLDRFEDGVVNELDRLEMSRMLDETGWINVYYSIDVRDTSDGGDDDEPKDYYGVSHTVPYMRSVGRLTAGRWDLYEDDPFLAAFLDPFGEDSGDPEVFQRVSYMTLAHELGHLLANRRDGLVRTVRLPCNAEDYEPPQNEYVDPYPVQFVFPHCCTKRDGERGYDAQRRIPNTARYFPHAVPPFEIDLRVLDQAKEKLGFYDHPGNLLLGRFEP